MVNLTRIFQYNNANKQWWITRKVSRKRFPARGATNLDVKMNLQRRKKDNKLIGETENVIRLAVDGCANRKYYRIVVGPHLGPRDKGEIEQLGTFDPFPNIFNEKTCALNFERIKYHMGMGAHVTRPVRRLLGLSGFLPLEPTLVFFAQHLRRRRLIEQKIKERDEAEKDSENEESNEKASAV